MDQVLQLVYEDGSPCPSKNGLTYKSVISFVCRPETGPTNRPMLVSLDKQTCTLFFSWHTPLACEQVVSACPMPTRLHPGPQLPTVHLPAPALLIAPGVKLGEGLGAMAGGLTGTRESFW